MGCVHRCTFCYVRGFEQRADRPADDRYGTSIRVKVNVAEVLRCELQRRSFRETTVAIGAATDPYQPAEGRYRLTRGCLEALAAAAVPFSIITRSPLIVRDVDVLAEASRRADVSVTFSVPTLDERRLALDRAGHRSPTPAAAGAVRPGRGRRAGLGRDGADPPRPLGPAGAARRGRPRGARRRGVRRVGERPLPQARHARAFPVAPRRRLARAAARVRAALRGPQLRATRARRRRRSTLCGSSRASTASATAGRACRGRARATGNSLWLQLWRHALTTALTKG